MKKKKLTYVEVEDKYMELFRNFRTFSHFISMNQLDYPEQMHKFTNEFDGFIFHKKNTLFGIRILKELFEEVEKKKKQ